MTESEARAAMIANMLSMVDGPLAWYAANPLATPTAQPAANQWYNHDTPGAFHIALQYHPGNADLIACRDLAKQGYINYIDVATATAGGVGDPYGHAHGLFELWEQDGDTEARDAALKVRDYGAGIGFGPGIWSFGSRPIAYRIEDFIDAHRLGLRTLEEPHWSNGVTWAIGHVDEWLGDPEVWAPRNLEMVLLSDPTGDWNLDNMFTQHFMMGLTGHALAAAHEYIHDELGETDDRILPALIRLAFMLRERHWRPNNVPGEDHPGDFAWAFYRDGHHSPADGEYGDWANMIVSGFFAYVYKRTGCTYFRTAGDEALIGAVDCNTISSPKEYAEFFRHFDDWDRWRHDTPGSEDDYLVALPAFRPYAAVGVASDPIRVMPLKAVTGTVTVTDGAGWTDTLTWSGDMAVKEIAYTPASVGAKTLSFSNDMGLANPPDQGWTATGESTPSGKVLLFALPGGNLFLATDTR